MTIRPENHGADVGTIPNVDRGYPVTAHLAFAVGIETRVFPFRFNMQLLEQRSREHGIGRSSVDHSLHWPHVTPQASRMPHVN